MKDKKFLEQLNLYLDGEIDPADAAELELEIQSNPARRRIYNDYCRIHRATKLVCEQFRAAGAAQGSDDGPAPARPLDGSEDGTEAFVIGGRTGGRAAPDPFRRVLFAGGLAAACTIGIFVGTRSLAPRTPDAPAPTAHVAIPEPEPAAPVVAAAPAEEQPATFPAPFAPEVREDPFVQLTNPRSDPFALTPWTVADDFARMVPATMSSPPVLKVDERFRPASMDSRNEVEGSREAGPFRLRLNERSPSIAPSEFGAQP